MIIDYVMPKLAMAMSEGTVTKWLVEEGQMVEIATELATVETEKVAYEVESPEKGYFHIVAPEGEVFECETVIGQFATTLEELEQLQNGAVAQTANEEQPASANDEAAASHQGTEQSVPAHIDRSKRIIASPLAKKLAKDASLDLHTVVGTGPNRRIVKRDVLAAVEARKHAPMQSYQQDILASMPLKGVRKVISDRMLQSLGTTAQLTGSWECDITNLLAFRAKLLAKEDVLGTRISVNSLLIKAIVCAIQQVPIVNSCVENDTITVYRNINIGIAIAMQGENEFDESLVVAVLKSVESLGLAEIDKQMKDLINRARTGQASSDEMSGSTITLSSTAGLAPPGTTSTPILNQPNAALVGPSTPMQKPVVHEGEIMARTIMPISFTFDHRAIDGAPASRFMSVLNEHLSHPELMLA